MAMLTARDQQSSFLGKQEIVLPRVSIGQKGKTFREVYAWLFCMTEPARLQL